MRFWIDLANSPHALFFAPIVRELRARGHDVVLSARDAAQTLPLCAAAGLEVTAIGAHGGRHLAGKGARFAERVVGLVRFGRGRRVDLCVSHNAYELAVAARLLGLPHLTLMDYEHQPANHLSFRLATRVLVPRACDVAALRRHGAGAKLRRFDGLKEEVYLEGFAPRPDFAADLEHLFFAERGLAFDPCRHVLVVLRPPPEAALYHRGASTAPFDEALSCCGGTPEARLVVLPRDATQRRDLARRLPENAVIPRAPLDGRELVAHADLVLCAGGTMGREAAVLGIPAYSLFTGPLGGVDRALIETGRLRHVASARAAQAIPIVHKPRPAQPVRSPARAQVLAELLDCAERARRTDGR